MDLINLLFLTLFNPAGLFGLALLVQATVLIAYFFPRQRHQAIGLIGASLVIIALALMSFYSQTYAIEFHDYDNYVPDHTIVTALWYTITDAPQVIGFLFTDQQNANSSLAMLAGFGLCQAFLATGYCIARFYRRPTR